MIFCVFVVATFFLWNAYFYSAKHAWAPNRLLGGPRTGPFFQKTWSPNRPSGIYIYICIYIYVHTYILGGRGGVLSLLLSIYIYIYVSLSLSLSLSLSSFLNFSWFYLMFLSFIFFFSLSLSLTSLSSSTPFSVLCSVSAMLKSPCAFHHPWAVLAVDLALLQVASVRHKRSLHNVGDAGMNIYIYIYKYSFTTCEGQWPSYMLCSWTYTVTRTSSQRLPL